MHVLLLSVLVFAVGYVAGWVGYAITRRRSGAFAAAMIAPVPLIYLMMSFAYGFMRGETVDIGQTIGTALLMLAICCPFTWLGAWQYLLKLDRLNRK